MAHFSWVRILRRRIGAPRRREKPGAWSPGDPRSMAAAARNGRRRRLLAPWMRRWAGMFGLGCLGLAAAISPIYRSLPAPLPRYALTDLGTLGGSSSKAFGINNLG